MKYEKRNKSLCVSGKLSFLSLILLLFVLASCKEQVPVPQSTEVTESKSNQTVQPSEYSERPTDSTEESQSSVPSPETFRSFFGHRARSL